MTHKNSFSLYGCKTTKTKHRTSNQSYQNQRRCDAVVAAAQAAHACRNLPRILEHSGSR